MPRLARIVTWTPHQMEAGPWGRRLAETPANCSLTIRECGLPAVDNRRRICGHSSVGRTTPCQGVGRRFESGCPLHSEATFVFHCRHSGSVCAKGAPDQDCRPRPPLGTPWASWRGDGTKAASLWKWTVGLLVRSPPFESLCSSKHSRVEPQAPRVGSVEQRSTRFQGGQAGFESRTVYHHFAGLAYGMCSSLPSWPNEFESRIPLHICRCSCDGLAPA